MIKKITNKIKYLAFTSPVLAAAGTPVPVLDKTVSLSAEGTTFSDLGNLTVGSMVSGAISLVMLIVALVFFFMLIWGGLKWVMSQGEEKAVTGARAQITNALIGLAIVFAAWAIMKLIAIVFGIDVLGGITIPTFNP